MHQRVVVVAVVVVKLFYLFFMKFWIEICSACQNYAGHVFSTGDLNWVSRFTCARFSMFAKQFLSEGYYLPWTNTYQDVAIDKLFKLVPSSF